MPVDISFDANKDAKNIAIHGVSLALAEKIDWSDVVCFPDDRRDYGELREVGFAPIGDRVFCVVFVQRGEVMRIISLRKANAREVTSYDQAFQELRLRDPDA